MSDQSDSQLADHFADRLAEHFQSVVIICTHADPDGTRVVCKRRGNYYATKGAVTEWLEEERNRDLAEKLKGEE